MRNEVIINGRLTGPRNVELDEPVADLKGEVHVILRPRGNGSPSDSETISQFLRGLPPGTRSREDIDKQLHDERSAWER